MTSKRALTFEDFWQLRHITDARLSPDGKTVAYVVTSVTEADGGSTSAIWLGNLEDGSTRQFTAGDAADTEPQWAPDSTRLAFVSTRHEGKPQIFVIGLQGGEPRRVTDVPHGAGAPRWSPDDRSICFSS